MANDALQAAVTCTPGTCINYLRELALELRFGWNHSMDDVWRQLGQEIWEGTRNPWVVLNAASEARINELADDPEFRRRVETIALNRRQYLQTPGWFKQTHPDSELSCVAYFSMEFGLSEALPIYSGGLGNVAGDQLKAASDLGLPIVGVGLLYQQGYFRQSIDPDGNQMELYPYNPPDYLPITPVRDSAGELVRLEFTVPGYKIWLRAWQAQVGRVTLYLLDTNDPANPPYHRGITSELYGGGPELRLSQELVLGVGGWRLLRRLGLKPEVCHLNEGHAAFAVLERAACFMEDNGVPFEVALAATRAGNLFTTHTPVEAGFDRFSPALMRRFSHALAIDKRFGISLERLLALGRLHAEDPEEPFNMAYLAIRGCGAINGVSQLHGEVSRRIFRGLFARWPLDEIPVGHVTNGVHTPSWDSSHADRFWTTCCGPHRWRGTMEGMGEAIRNVPDHQLWELRTANRAELIPYVREKLVQQLIARGQPQEMLDRARGAFDPNALTLGFARRFATYKRPNLLLHDPERLMRILTNPRFPVQLVIAGKAHPADRAGKAMVREWLHFVTRPEVRQHAIFLADYDLMVAERLVQGVDLWINTPRRPWEACGTSGMKVLVNGGLNLSELDGWWAEAYAPELGWSLGDRQEHDDDPAWDAAEAEALYALLENEAIPKFYERNEKGIPTGWAALMRESMARLTPQFSANRAVREYTESYYLPLAAGARKRQAEHGALAAELAKWSVMLERHWSSMHIAQMQIERLGDNYVFNAPIYLNEVAPEAVRPELYAESSDHSPIRIPMARTTALVGSVNGYLFSAQAPADRPATDYTVRIIPAHADAAVPLECHQIFWER